MSEKEVVASRATTVRMIALYVIVLVIVVVGMDILFFRHHIWYRLIANVGVVLVFAAFGRRWLTRRPS